MRGALFILLLAIVAQAEDLKTLDGKEFRDVTGVTTNYLPTVVIVHAGGRTGVPLATLPPDFRAKYSLPTPPAPQPSEIQAPSIDQLLAHYQDSELKSEKKITVVVTNDPTDLTYTMVLSAKPYGFELMVLRMWTSSVKREYDASTSRFHYGSEGIAKRAFEKFLEWDAIAASTNAETFEKEILSFPGNDKLQIPYTRTFTFHWNNESFRQQPGDDRRGTLMDENRGFALYGKLEIAAFLLLLPDLPQLKEELLKKLRAKEAQQILFK